MAYNSTLETAKIESALLSSLKTKKIEYNITQDKSSNYASLAEAIAAVDDNDYKTKGIVLTFYTGTEWVSKRYNGEDASGFATEANWVDAGGSIQETDWTPFNVIINRIIAENYRDITDEDYNTLKSFIKEPDKLYYPVAKSLEGGNQIVIAQSSVCFFVLESSSDAIIGIMNKGTDNYLVAYEIAIPPTKNADVQISGFSINANSSNLSIESNDRQINLALSGNGSKFLSDNGTYKEIPAGTQYLDLSMFSEDSGTLSDEDYQKVVKAYEDEIKSFKSNDLEGFILTGTMYHTTESSEYQITSAVTFAFNNSPTIFAFYALIGKDKSYTRYFGSVAITTKGKGNQCLTDRGEYAEFAQPTRVLENTGGGPVTSELSPNILYKFGERPSLTITLGGGTVGIVNEYMFEFRSGTTATTLSVPNSVKWSGGNAPTIEANKTYQVSIVDNLAVYAAF